MRNSQILRAIDLIRRNHILINILLPETQQRGLTEPFSQREDEGEDVQI